MDTTICVACGQSVAVGKFCSHCGVPLPPGSSFERPASETTLYTASSAPSTSAPSGPRHALPSDPEDTDLLPERPALQPWEIEAEERARQARLRVEAEVREFEARAAAQAARRQGLVPDAAAPVVGAPVAGYEAAGAYEPESDAYEPNQPAFDSGAEVPAHVASAHLYDAQLAREQAEAAFLAQAAAGNYYDQDDEGDEPPARPRLWLPVVVALAILLVVAGVLVGPQYLGPLVGGVAAQAPSPSLSPATSASAQASKSTASTPSPTPTPSPSKSPIPVDQPAAMKSNPNPVLGNVTLSTQGLGPLLMGMQLSALKTGGYVVESKSQCTGQWVANPALRNDGVELLIGTTLVQITLVSPTYATRSGARVGMTVAEIKRLYGTQLVTLTKTGDAGEIKVLAAVLSGKEVLFLTDFNQGPFTDTSKITSIVARTSSTDLRSLC